MPSSLPVAGLRSAATPVVARAPFEDQAAGQPPDDVEPATKVGPYYAEMLYDRVIKFGPKK